MVENKQISKIDRYLNSLSESERIMPFDEVKSYNGIFTGKTVKTAPGEDGINSFKKGDKVLVLNYKEYSRYLRSRELILEGVLRLTSGKTE